MQLDTRIHQQDHVHIQKRQQPAVGSTLSYSIKTSKIKYNWLQHTSCDKNDTTPLAEVLTWYVKKKKKILLLFYFLFWTLSFLGKQFFQSMWQLSNIQHKVIHLWMQRLKGHAKRLFMSDQKGPLQCREENIWNDSDLRKTIRLQTRVCTRIWNITGTKCAPKQRTKFVLPETLLVSLDFLAQSTLSCFCFCPERVVSANLSASARF